MEIVNYINNQKNKNLSGKQSIKTLNAVEEKINVHLKGEYLIFLKEFGCGDINGVEYYGVQIENGLDYSGHLSIVNQTMNYRSYGIKKNLIPIASTGFGPIYVIDTKKDNSPIYIWANKNHPLEKAYNSFFSMLKDL